MAPAQAPPVGAWAIPGGMVDPGEKVPALSLSSHHLHQVSVTVKREFMEEALDSTGEGMGEKVEALTAMVDNFFNGGEEVYRWQNINPFPRHIPCSWHHP